MPFCVLKDRPVTDFGDVDALAAAGGSTPGSLGWLRDRAGRELVHAGRTRSAVRRGPMPDDGTVFRIASMSKSFTASAVLALRDDGKLRLDDAADVEPELRRWPSAASDGARACPSGSLLTMTAGFPTDDRRGTGGGLPLDDFTAFFARRSASTGRPVPGRVLQHGLRDPGPGHHRRHRDRLPGLHPRPPAAPAEHVPHRVRGGRVRRTGPRPRVPARAPRVSPRFPSTRAARSPRCGRIFSCVRNLTRSVAGFAAAFPQPGPRRQRRAPVRRATQREMRLPAGPDRVDSDQGFPRSVAPALSAYSSGCSWRSTPPSAGSSATAAGTESSRSDVADTSLGTGVIRAQQQRLLQRCSRWRPGS